MSYNSPSIGDLLMATLNSAGSTRRFYAIIREREFKKYKKESVQISLSRLRKKGYVNIASSGWSITPKGKKFLKTTKLLSYIISPFTENSPPNIIISFDIPEKNRVLRNWLRNQIKIFGYKMLQQSLWIGPGPLPSEFIKRLEDLKIRKNIKTFKIAKIKS
jgi:phenylacetic acid degradation operon negative regulatory protein